MRKLVLSLFMVFLLFGMLLHAPLVLAQNDSDNSGTSVKTEAELEVRTDNSGSGNVEDGSDEDENDKDDDTRVRERTETRTREILTRGGCTIKIEIRTKIEEGRRVEVVERKMECADGTRAEVKIRIDNRTEDGRFRERIKYEIEGEEFDVEVDEEIELEEEQNRTHYKLKARLRNGDVAEIKIMPDQASEIALERLRALNFTVELREVVHQNVPRVVYNIETNKHGRFLGVFKLAMKVEGQVDPETGEFLGISKPWWAFLVSGEDNEVRGDENTKVEISGDIALSEEVRATLDSLVATFEEIEEKVELKLKVKKQNNETSVKVEIKEGALNEEQQSLWETLQSQAQLLVENAEGDDIELEIEIEHELELEEDEDENETEEETDELTINLLEQNDSGESGIATLTEENSQVTVVLSMTGFTQSVSQPAHIHLGSCPDVGSITYPLTNVLNGESETTLNVTLGQLESELPLAINIHKSADEASVWVACGDIVF